MADRTRACYLGPVQRYRLEAAVAPINEAFDSMAYLVGSCLTRPDYRDVDVRLILDDADFIRLFGADLDQAHGRATALWTSLAVTYSRDLSALTGLDIDFQIQAVTPANAKELGERHALFVTRPAEMVSGIDAVTIAISYRHPNMALYTVQEGIAEEIRKAGKLMPPLFPQEPPR